MRVVAEEARSLAEVVGINARRLRGDATSDELAKAARAEGLNWGTGRISDLEHGRVSPTLSMLVALAHALRSVHGRPVRLADLVRHDGFITLTRELTITSAALQRFLDGQDVSIKVKDVPHGPELKQRMREALDSHAKCSGVKLPPAVDEVRTDLVEQVFRQSGEAEARIAKSLGLHGEDFAAVSAYLWGHTLSAERDRRVGPGANAQDKGRVTRNLKAEVGAVLDGDD